MLPQILTVFVITAVVQKCTGMYWSISFIQINEKNKKASPNYFICIFQKYFFCDIVVLIRNTLNVTI